MRIFSAYHLHGFQGTYVLTDNSFRPFARMSATSSSEAVLRAQPVRDRFSVGNRCADQATSPSGFLAVSYEGRCPAWASVPVFRQKHLSYRWLHFISKLLFLSHRIRCYRKGKCVLVNNDIKDVHVVDGRALEILQSHRTALRRAVRN